MDVESERQHMTEASLLGRMMKANQRNREWKWKERNEEKASNASQQDELGSGRMREKIEPGNGENHSTRHASREGFIED